MTFTADTPTIPAKFTDLTHEERERLVLDIRERREKPIREYMELMARLRENKKDKLTAQHEKRIAQCQDLIEKLDRQQVKLEKYVRECRAIEIELEAM